jgi:putative hydrolase of the HAD superfamily
MLKAVFFDLDYTLYNQKYYLLGAFREISKYISSKYNIKERKAYAALKKEWKKRKISYPFLFDRFLEELSIWNKRLIKELIDIFHNHKPNIRLYPETREVLENLNKEYILGIITDGHPKMQKEKIKALEISSFFPHIIYTQKLGREFKKPSPLVFKMILEKLKISPKELIYIGDNPQVDFKGAKELGIYTIRVLRGEFKTLRGEKTDKVIFNLKRLPQILRNFKD